MKGTVKPEGAAPGGSKCGLKAGRGSRGLVGQADGQTDTRCRGDVKCRRVRRQKAQDPLMGGGG